MSSFNDLFNPASVKNDEAASNPDLYKVKFQDGVGGVYKSVVRFAPNPKDRNKCTVSKFVTWLKNPVTGQGMYVDDPRTLGQYSPVSEMFGILWKTGDKRWQDFAKAHLSTREQHASIVQIIQDNQHPDLACKFKVFTYSKTLKDKLYAEEHPNAGYGINPFNPINGRYFSLVCGSKSNFNNFDNSVFFDCKDANGQTVPSGLKYFNAATNAWETVTESTDKEAFYQYMLANCPDLTPYEYHPWTPEQEKYVMDTLNVIRQVFSSGNIQSAATTAYQMNMQTVNTPTPSIAVNPTPTFPGASIPQQPVNETAPSAPIVQAPTPAPTAPAPVEPQEPAAPAPGLSVGSPVITGATIPNVAPATAPTGAQPAIGDINSFINDL